MVCGELIEYEPTKCTICQSEGAFSLDETDAAIVNREMGDMYTLDAASVGASYASPATNKATLNGKCIVKRMKMISSLTTVI
jgi:hypothetical protein